MEYEGLTLYIHNTIWPGWYFATASTKKHCYFASGDSRESAVEKLKHQIDIWRDI